jgi:ATP-dependent helicase HrpB
MMLPTAPTDPALPIDAVLATLVSALEAHPCAVLVAPPGAGKTTRVPLALLADATCLAGRRIIMLEPRRLAARAAAQRMAQTLGESVGETVGLRVRLETRVSRRTRIEVVTEGVFARMILEDPLLDDVGLVIFDEFHERSLDADFGLALARDAQTGLREDLRILVMSATLDGARVARLLGQDGAPAPVVESQGHAYPVETRHGGRDPRRPITEDVIDRILHALARDEGSVLVFLPGAGEIRRVERALGERISDASILIAPLYGALDRAEQDRAIAPAPPGRRKIVLATSIAETSLTIEGVRIVIDSGLSREPRFEPGSGLTRLETVRVSRAGADQRRGRAGRTAPGICYRLWEEAATGALEPFQRPEILAADLTGLMLDCAAWGETDPARLPFLDPPPTPALIEARKTLLELEAINSDGRITETGRALRALPLPPRLARMVVAAAQQGPVEAALAADCAAVLVERGLGGDDPDLGGRIARFRREDGARAKAARAMALGWARSLREDAAREPEGDPGPLIALAYPDRIAASRGRDGGFLMANGRGALIDPAHSLAGADYLAIAEISGAAGRARILSAAPLSRAAIRDLAAARITLSEEISYDPAAQGLRAGRVERLDALVLARTPLAVPATAQAAMVLAEGIARNPGPAQWPWNPALLQWRARIGFLRRAEGPESGWPDLSDEALAETARDWLAPFLTGTSALAQISNADLQAALEALLPWELRQRLDAEAPSHVEVPTGSRIPVDYTGEEPAIAVRVQELFGLNQHPTVAGGRLPLVLELLSPARRPIQITRDLPGFWRGSWADVRAQMRGRYPRHPWPEDPAAAAPTRRANPRRKA